MNFGITSPGSKARFFIHHITNVLLFKLNFVNNFINLKQFKKIKRAKMIATILIIATISSMIIWDNILNRKADNIKIPESGNKTYNIPETISPGDIISEIDNNKGKPILLYIYTTWCSICKKQFPVVNEMARKFQNTDLKIITVAIDKNIDDASFANYLHSYHNIYFSPKYLLYSDGLADLLLKKGIKYNKKIPFTVLLDREGRINTQFIGYDSEKSLNRKIIKFYK